MVRYSILVMFIHRHRTHRFSFTSQQPKYMGQFIGGLNKQEKEAATQAFTVLMILMVLGPFINLLSSYVESRFTTLMVDKCRRKMIRSTLKGGTKFDEEHRPGKLQDTFSSQVNQMEQYINMYFIQIIPQLATVISAVVTCATIFPFAGTYFDNTNTMSLLLDQPLTNRISLTSL